MRPPAQISSTRPTLVRYGGEPGVGRDALPLSGSWRRLPAWAARPSARCWRALNGPAECVDTEAAARTDGEHRIAGRPSQEPQAAASRRARRARARLSREARPGRRADAHGRGSRAGPLFGRGRELPGAAGCRAAGSAGQRAPAPLQPAPQNLRTPPPNGVWARPSRSAVDRR
jgi:hypothetical protein